MKTVEKLMRAFIIAMLGSLAFAAGMVVELGYPLLGITGVISATIICIIMQISIVD